METVSYRDKCDYLIKIIECKTKYELLYTILFNLIKQHRVYIILTIAYKKHSFVYTAHSIVYLITVLHICNKISDITQDIVSTNSTVSCIHIKHTVLCLKHKV